MLENTKTHLNEDLGPLEFSEHIVPVQTQHDQWKIEESLTFHE